MSADPRSVIIIGGGQAGYQAAASLREEGFDGAIRIFGDEPYAPYQRPPLSKDLLPKTAAAELAFASPAELAASNIDLETGAAVRSIDRGARRILLEDGRSVGFGTLIIATGARNRQLGIETPDCVSSIRGLKDADAMRERFGAARQLVVIGAGFLGLEIAAMANALGLEVNVVESAAAAMGRAVSRTTADVMMRHHQAKGIRFHLNRALAGFETLHGALAGVRLDDGTMLPADAAVVSIGIMPNADIAAAAGLDVANGILVDSELRTSDPGIFAIGDCAAFPSHHAGGIVRLESVQNAVDQGRHVAAAIVGRVATYDALPWFWSEQGGMRLQIAGLAASQDESVMVGDPQGGAYSTFRFRAGRLVAVESVNRPADHATARRCLSSGRTPSRDLLDDAAFDLRAWFKASAAR